MRIYDEDAIQALGDKVREKEKGSSSHWDQYHSTFEYKNGRLTGVQGFGGDRGPGTIIHKIAHWLLQTPIRRMGEKFSHFPECIKLAKSVAQRQGRPLDVDILRQALTLSLLRESLPMDQLKGPVVIIGDGFGTLGSLFLLWQSNLKIVWVNLTKTLLVDVMYARKVLTEARICFVDTPEDYRKALEEPDVSIVAVRADDAGMLQTGEIGLAVNIASMQEMNPSTVADYFSILRASKGETYFYCCNRLAKTLPDGTEVLFDQYPWRSSDSVLLNELCPWHQYYYRPRPPFYFSYDGPLWHRLALLNKP